MLATPQGSQQSDSPSPAAAARNIVVFVADDHGQDAGAYGHPVVRTPNLDALAADGVLFRHAFATTASCSASRSVILSGLHNHRTAQYGHEHDYSHFRSYDNLRTLPMLLREAGYRTARIGKFHVAPESAYPFEQVLPGNGRSPVEMADTARAVMTPQDGRPFFLYFATNDPHRGGGRAEELDARPDRFGNVPEGYPGIESVSYDPADVVVPPWLPDTLATRAELAQYYQAVSRLDQGLGRLVHLLKEQGVYERTLIIYLSDHGAAFPGAKTTVYEPGLRSPLIVRHPDAKRRGITSDAMVSWVDLTPTILEFAGAEPPVYEQHIGSAQVRQVGDFPDRHGLHGQSFLAFAQGDEAEGREEVYASHTFHEIQMYYPMRVVRGRKYKLIWNIAHQLPFPFATDLWSSGTWQAAWKQGPEARYGQRTVATYVNRPEFELYDLERDPHESKNLADDPKYEGVLAKHKQKLKAFQSRTSDPWIIKWTYQ
ncbi:MAG: sulfatase-like hydrolase/transferase [Luteitalea sp.]|nr:sulfatase-like hydrolase/transferase [Luteitalea sp.]